jgi:hypothetical protein
VDIVRIQQRDAGRSSTVNILIILVAAVVFALPTAVWFAIRARRADRARPAPELAPEPHYGSEQTSRRDPNTLGTAWARTTTFIE